MVQNRKTKKILFPGSVLVDDQCAPSLTAAMVNHFKSVKLKKQQDDEEDDTAISVHQQPLVTKSCYHQDRDIAKRQNTAAKLRPKADGRIVQTSDEVWIRLIRNFYLINSSYFFEKKLDEKFQWHLNWLSEFSVGPGDQSNLIVICITSLQHEI